MDKKLYRSNRDVVFGGVCGGLAEYFGVDAVLIRIIWFVTIFCGGLGIVAYLAAWCIIPEKNDSDTESAEGTEQKNVKPRHRTEVFGWILIAIGLLILCQYILPWFSWHYIGPIILICIGAAFIIKYKDR